MEEKLRFLADRMLGRLGRWLRLMGLDCESVAVGEDAAEKALEEGRILLTRNRALMRRRRLGPHLLVGSDHLPQQLEQVIAHFGIDPLAQALSRCTRCNRLLEKVGPAPSQTAVPWQVRQLNLPLSRCPQCGRFYWPASHSRRIRDRLERLQLYISPRLSERR